MIVLKNLNLNEKSQLLDKFFESLGQGDSDLGHEIARDMGLTYVLCDFYDFLRERTERPVE